MPQTLKIRRQTQGERRAESELRLLTAAAEIIATEGFGAASLERIGAVAGYSRGLASQKFGSKDGLVTAVIDAVLARNTALLAARETPDASPLDAIIAYADTILAQIEADIFIRAYWVMMASAIANRLPMQAAFLAEHERVKTRLSRLISEGQARAEIDPAIDADAAALSIGSMLLGIGVECLLDPALDIPRVRAAALASISRMRANPDLQPKDDIP